MQIRRLSDAGDMRDPHPNAPMTDNSVFSDGISGINTSDSVAAIRASRTRRHSCLQLSWTPGGEQTNKTALSRTELPFWPMSLKGLETCSKL